MMAIWRAIQDKPANSYVLKWRYNLASPDRDALMNGRFAPVPDSCTAAFWRNRFGCAVFIGGDLRRSDPLGCRVVTGLAAVRAGLYSFVHPRDRIASTREDAAYECA